MVNVVPVGNEHLAAVVHVPPAALIDMSTLSAAAKRMKPKVPNKDAAKAVASKARNAPSQTAPREGRWRGGIDPPEDTANLSDGLLASRRTGISLKGLSFIS